MNKIIILAGGKGKRMKSELPKVLLPINDRPMIKYLIESVLSSGLDNNPIIVASPSNKDILQESLSEYNLDFAVQGEPLGTGHAVLSAKNLITEEVDNILVLYGDHPFITAQSIQKLFDNHQAEVSLMTTEVDNFVDWQKNFYHWGRIIRENNKIKEIIEFKDATDDVKNVKEVNPAIFCFNRKWLFSNLDNLKNNNSQGEYYLTDLIKTAFDQGINISSASINPLEAMGINSPEELDIARKLVLNKKYV